MCFTFLLYIQVPLGCVTPFAVINEYAGRILQNTSLHRLSITTTITTTTTKPLSPKQVGVAEAIKVQARE